MKSKILQKQNLYDHGHSAEAFFTSAQALHTFMINKVYKQFNYDEIGISVNEILEATKQIITSAKPENISIIVNKRLAEIKNENFDIRGMKVRYFIDGKKQVLKLSNILDIAYSQLKNFYIMNLCNQSRVMHNYYLELQKIKNKDITENKDIADIEAKTISSSTMDNNEDLSNINIQYGIECFLTTIEYIKTQSGLDSKIQEE